MKKTNIENGLEEFSTNLIETGENYELSLKL